MFSAEVICHVNALLDRARSTSLGETWPGLSRPRVAKPSGETSMPLSRPAAGTALKEPQAKH